MSMSKGPYANMDDNTDNESNSESHAGTDPTTELISP